MKYFFFPLITWMLLLTGCSQKSGFFAPDRLEQKALTLTQKGEIYNSLEIKASLVATYLNPLLKEYADKDRVHFLVSVFIDNDYSDKKRAGLYNPHYRLSLDNQAPEAIKALKFDDPLVKIAPVKNAWSKYYLVTFKRPSDSKMQMLFKSERYGACTLNFSAD